MLVFYCFAVHSTDSKTQTKTKKLSSIVYVEPLYEIFPFFSFYFSENNYTILQTQEELGTKLPYYHELENPYDSITFTYNQQDELIFIRYHRRHTIQTDSVIYDKKGRLIQCFSYSDKENPNFKTKQTNYKYEKNSILQYDNGVWKKTYTINPSNHVIELKTNGYHHVYEYNPNKTIKKIIETHIESKSSAERTVAYVVNKQSTFVFGNTPQWFCLTNKFLFMFNSYVHEMYNPERRYITFNVKYKQENLTNTESILTEELYRNDDYIKTRTFELKYAY